MTDGMLSRPPVAPGGGTAIRWEDLRPTRTGDSGPADRVLVVCTGNLIRSPFIAGILAAQFARAGLPEVDFESAGTAARAGDPASTRARELARFYGADIDGHVARPLTEGMLREADVVVCAAREHRRAVLERRPSLINRTLTLVELGHAAQALGPELTGSPVSRWAELCRRGHAYRSAVDADDADVPDPYRRGREHWWSFEQTTMTAIMSLLRVVVGK